MLAHPTEFQAALLHHRAVKDEVIARTAGITGCLSADADALAASLERTPFGSVGKCRCGACLVIVDDEITTAETFVRAGRLVARLMRERLEATA